MKISQDLDLILRPMTLDDVPQVLALGRACFPSIPADRHWRPAQLQAHVTRFPEGQLVVEAEGRIIASATNLRVRQEAALAPHTWRSITGEGYLTTHEPDGDVLYGTEVMVHPEWRRMGVARLLYRARQGYVRHHGLRAFVAGGRIPGYREHAEAMTAEEYVAEVLAGRLTDRTLTPQLRSGLQVEGVLSRYMHDPNSLDHATLLVWDPVRAARSVAISGALPTPRATRV